MSSQPTSFTVEVPRSDFLCFMRALRAATFDGDAITFSFCPGMLCVASPTGSASFATGDCSATMCTVSYAKLKRLVSSQWASRNKPQPFRIRVTPEEGLLSFENAGVRAAFKK